MSFTSGVALRRHIRRMHEAKKLMLINASGSTSHESAQTNAGVHGYQTVAGTQGSNELFSHLSTLAQALYTLKQRLPNCTSVADRQHALLPKRSRQYKARRKASLQEVREHYRNAVASVRSTRLNAIDSAVRRDVTFIREFLSSVHFSKFHFYFQTPTNDSAQATSTVCSLSSKKSIMVSQLKNDRMCNVCDRIFGKKSDRDRHLRIHTGI